MLNPDVIHLSKNAQFEAPPADRKQYFAILFGRDAAMHLPQVRQNEVAATQPELHERSPASLQFP